MALFRWVNNGHSKVVLGHQQQMRNVDYEHFRNTHTTHRIYLLTHKLTNA